MRSVIKVLQDVGLLVARLVLGGVLLLHGLHRWQAGMASSVSFLQNHHVPQPHLWAWGALVLELLGGFLMVFGLGTPLVGLAVAVQQALTIWWITRHGPLSGMELNAALGALGLVLAALGSGRAGVDHLFNRSSDEPRHVYRDDDPA